MGYQVHTYIEKLQLTQYKFCAYLVCWICPSCANCVASCLDVDAGLEVGWCKDPDRGLPAPDKILFLDISVEDAMKVLYNNSLNFVLVPRQCDACVVCSRGRSMTHSLHR